VANGADWEDDPDTIIAAMSRALPPSSQAVEQGGLTGRERLEKIEAAARRLVEKYDEPNVGNPHFEIQVLRNLLGRTRVD